MDRILSQEELHEIFDLMENQYREAATLLHIQDATFLMHLY